MSCVYNVLTTEVGIEVENKQSRVISNITLAYAWRERGRSAEQNTPVKNQTWYSLNTYQLITV
jgi:hypothetical protein